jgi:hypothetical protein
VRNLESIGITYLKDSGCEIDGITIYGSPCSPRARGAGLSCTRVHLPHTRANTGAMAFQAEDLSPVWAQVPEHVDVLITHTPAHGHGDLTEKGASMGDRSLLTHIEQRIVPRVHVCGERLRSCAQGGSDGITQDIITKATVLLPLRTEESFSLTHVLCDTTRECVTRPSSSISTRALKVL